MTTYILTENDYDILDNEYVLNRWHFRKEILEGWKRLHYEFPKSESHDCVINTMNFLQLLPRDEAEDLARRHNFAKTGCFPKQKMDGIYEKYIKEFGTKTSQYLFNFPIYSKSFKYLLDTLEEGYATLIDLNKDGSGHTVVACVYNGQLVILDPQQEKVYKTDDEIVTWITRHQWCILGLYFKSNNDKRFLEESAVRKVKSIGEPPLKKRRLKSRTPSPVIGNYPFSDFKKPIRVVSTSRSLSMDRSVSMDRSQSRSQSFPTNVSQKKKPVKKSAKSKSTLKRSRSPSRSPSLSPYNNPYESNDEILPTKVESPKSTRSTRKSVAKMPVEPIVPLRRNTRNSKKKTDSPNRKLNPGEKPHTEDDDDDEL